MALIAVAIAASVALPEKVLLLVCAVAVLSVQVKVSPVEVTCTLAWVLEAVLLMILRTVTGR